MVFFYIFKFFQDVSRETLPKAYQPKAIEEGWYKYWESQGYFQPNKDGKPFTLLLPPPNVTGTLHLGHALTGTIQDVIARWWVCLFLNSIIYKKILGGE